MSKKQNAAQEAVERDLAIEAQGFSNLTVVFGVRLAEKSPPR